jgi:hypothetical protein
MASSAHSGPTTIRQRLDLALHRELDAGETIVWQGMKLARVEPKGFLIYLFALPWTGFALFWMSMAIMLTGGSEADGFGWMFALFGLPFVLIGLAMFAVPFLSYFQRGRILFAVTNTRVLKLSLGRELTVVAVLPGKIRTTVRTESGDGTGTIELSLSTSVVGYNGRPTRQMEFGRVEDVFGADKAIATLLASKD